MAGETRKGPGVTSVGLAAVTPNVACGDVPAPGGLGGEGGAAAWFASEGTNGVVVVLAFVDCGMESASPTV